MVNGRYWPVAAYKESCIGEFFSALERQLCTVFGPSELGGSRQPSIYDITDKCLGYYLNSCSCKVNKLLSVVKKLASNITLLL